MWVYGGIIVGSFAMAMATCYTGHSQLPWWALIVAIILAACEWLPLPSRAFELVRAHLLIPCSHVPLRLRHLRHHRLQDRRPAARADARRRRRARKQSGEHVYVSL